MRFRITLALAALLVVGMAGTAGAQSPSPEGGGGPLGDLVVLHDLPGAPDVNLHVLPYGTNAEIPVANGLEAGQQTARIPLPPGQHALIIDNAEDGTELGRCAFRVKAGEVTYANASTCLGITPAPSESPSATASPTASATPTASASASASASPSASIRTPTRVETGGGGAAGDDGALVLAGLAGMAALASAGVLVTRGRRA